MWVFFPSKVAPTTLDDGVGGGSLGLPQLPPWLEYHPHYAMLISFQTLPWKSIGFPIKREGNQSWNCGRHTPKAPHAMIFAFYDFLQDGGGGVM